MQWRSSFSALVLAGVWIASTLCASAQTVSEELAASTVEFWSTRYQRFYENQPQYALDFLGRPPGGLRAPSDVVICEPHSTIATSSEPAPSEAASASPDPTVDVVADPSRLTTGLRPR